MMSDPGDQRLQRLLGGPELARVRQRLRRHFERTEPGDNPPRLRLGGLDSSEQAALRQLTGSPSRIARSMLLDFTDLDARLRASGVAPSLRDALERLDGPIIPKTSLRRELEKQWSAVAARQTDDMRLQAWLQTPTALTLLKRVARDPKRAAQLLTGAEAVLRRLPAAGMTRSRLAAETLGDAHGLDGGRPVATVVLAAWGQYDAQPLVAAADSPVRSRDLWARAGILVNELARPALTLNLPLAGETSTHCTWGEPAWLSLRQLLRRQLSWQHLSGQSIFVCENPNIVAIAADQLGAACAPLVCTDGMPAAAQRTLLDQLVDGGALLQYHGDFDWAGIGIGNVVMRRWRARPWRYGVEDYLGAVDRTACGQRHALYSNVLEACWDAGLGPAMRGCAIAIAEEAVVETLMEDLQEK